MCCGIGSTVPRRSLPQLHSVPLVGMVKGEPAGDVGARRLLVLVHAGSGERFKLNAGGLLVLEERK